MPRPPLIPGNVKGSALAEVIKALRTRREVALSYLPEELHHYLSTRILLSEWYPDDDWMAALRALEKVMPEIQGDFWQWAGEYRARADFQDVYAAMVKSGDPGSTLKRYPSTWRLYHDAGLCRAKALAPNLMRIHVFHYLATYDEFCRLQLGHLRALAAVAGAKRPQARILRLADAENPAAWEVTWQS